MRSNKVKIELGWDTLWHILPRQPVQDGMGEINTLAKHFIKGRKDYPKGLKLGMRLEVRLLKD